MSKPAAPRWQVGDLVSYRGLNSRIARVVDYGIGSEPSYMLAPPRDMLVQECDLYEPVTPSIEALTDVVFMLEKYVQLLKHHVNEQTCGHFLNGIPNPDRAYFMLKAMEEAPLPEQPTADAKRQRSLSPRLLSPTKPK